MSFTSVLMLEMPKAKISPTSWSCNVLFIFFLQLKTDSTWQHVFTGVRASSSWFLFIFSETLFSQSPQMTFHTLCPFLHVLSSRNDLSTFCGHAQLERILGVKDVVHHALELLCYLMYSPCPTAPGNTTQIHMQTHSRNNKLLVGSFYRELKRHSQ